MSVDVLERVLATFDDCHDDRKRDPKSGVVWNIPALRSELRDSQHFAMDEHFWSAAHAAAQAATDADGVVHLPLSARLPADPMTLHFPEFPEGVYVLRSLGSAVAVDHIKPGRFPLPLGMFRRQDSMFAPHACHEKVDLVNSEICQIAMALSLINIPRFVERRAAGTRQMRRTAQRGRGIPTDAWHRVSWTCGKPVRVKDVKDCTGARLPMHFRRGFYRRAQRHWKDAEPSDEDDFIRGFGPWKQWIEPDWVGHPRYGIKVSYHAPKLTPDVIRKKLERLSARPGMR